MAIRKAIAIASGLAFYVAGGVAMGFDEMKVSSELPPMEKPATVEVGYEWHTVKKGKNIVDKVVSVDGDTVTWEDSEGCRWTEKDMSFGPSTAWSNCSPWDDGTQKVSSVKGEIWPLKKKNKIKYSFSGKDITGATWSEKRSCKVKKQVRVKVPAGEYDTYKVVCSQPGNTRTWWISPELGKTVAFKNKHGLSELTKP